MRYKYFHKVIKFPNTFLIYKKKKKSKDFFQRQLRTTTCIPGEKKTKHRKAAAQNLDLCWMTIHRKGGTLSNGKKNLTTSFAYHKTVHVIGKYK